MTTPLPYVGPQFDATSLCAEIGDGDDVWFPEVGGSVVTAKRMCARCENEDACLQWALDNGEVSWGVWGGKTPAERQRLLRERATAPAPAHRPRDPIRHGTEGGYKAHHRRGDVLSYDDPCGCRAASRLASAQRRERRAS